MCRDICLHVHVAKAASNDGWLLCCIGPLDWPAGALAELNASYSKVCQLTAIIVGAADLGACLDINARILVLELGLRLLCCV